MNTTQSKVPSRVMRAIAGAAYANGAHNKPWFTSYYGGTWPCRHKLHKIYITPKERYIHLQFYNKSMIGTVTLCKERYKVSCEYDMQDLFYTLKTMTKAIKRTPPNR